VVDILKVLPNTSEGTKHFCLLVVSFLHIKPRSEMTCYFPTFSSCLWSVTADVWE